jgi:hypothetical protein
LIAETTFEFGGLRAPVLGTGRVLFSRAESLVGPTQTLRNAQRELFRVW